MFFFPLSVSLLSTCVHMFQQKREKNHIVVFLYTTRISEPGVGFWACNPYLRRLNQDDKRVQGQKKQLSRAGSVAQWFIAYMACSMPCAQSKKKKE